jgi:hypothetical protein
MMVGFPPFARNINAKVKEWPNIFLQLRRKAVDLKMPGFLTEFGCSYGWKGHTTLKPRAYHHSVVRACIDLQFQQVEANLLYATYWSYDLYNRKKWNDNWND